VAIFYPNLFKLNYFLDIIFVISTGFIRDYRGGALDSMWMQGVNADMAIKTEMWQYVVASEGKEFSTWRER